MIHNDEFSYGPEINWGREIDSRNAEITRLREALEAAEAAVSARVEAAEEARRALRPFAFAYEPVDDQTTGRPDLKRWINLAGKLKIADFRAAAIAFKHLSLVLPIEGDHHDPTPRRPPLSSPW